MASITLMISRQIQITFYLIGQTKTGMSSLALM